MSTSAILSPLPSQTTNRTQTATPANYLTYSFPLPEHRYVGILACQRDPLLTELVATVVKCEKLVRGPEKAEGAGKKKAGKRDAGSEVMKPVEDQWELILDDTVLFPEGGGQPSDFGTLTPLSGGDPVRVASVVRRNLSAVHTVGKAFEVGEKVLVKVDEERRKDLMCQHTGQHLLSGVIDADLKIDTLGWSLQPYPQPSYIELPRSVTLEEIASIQKRCNDYIARGTSVSVQMSLAAKEVLEGTKIPEDYRGEDGAEGVVRVVEIHGLGDANPCCGTHYPFLSHLQSLFILPHQTTIRSTNSRLYFLVGPRVLAHLSSTHGTTREASLELGCSTNDLSERVKLLNLSSREGIKREKRMREELAGFVAHKLWAQASSRPDDRAIKWAASVREEDATNSLDFLLLVAGELKGLASPESPHVFAIAVGIGASSPTTSGGSLLVFGSEDLVGKAGKEIGEKFKGRVKGGGKGRWQGKLVGARWELGDEAKLEEVLKAVAESP
ncbi:ThrRS/AlaRS common domain-containing protein [Meredithblackwellia eburnea MCA 4105]